MSNGHYVKARKDHRCTFCANKIFKGIRYWYERVTPWDHPDNQSYFVLKAHARCIETWHVVGADFDYTFPEPGRDWTEMVVWEWRRKKRLAAGVCTEHRKEPGVDLPKATVAGRYISYWWNQGKASVCEDCAVRLERSRSFRRDQPVAAAS